MLIVLGFYGISLIVLGLIAVRIENSDSISAENKITFTKIIGGFGALVQFMMIPLGWFAIYISINEDWGWSYLFKLEVWSYIGMGFLVAIPIIILAIIGINYKK